VRRECGVGEGAGGVGWMGGVWGEAPLFLSCGVHAGISSCWSLEGAPWR